MKNWLKLIGIAVAGAAIIVGVNEFFIAPKSIEAPLVAEGGEGNSSTNAPSQTSPEDWEKLMEKRKKEQAELDAKKLATSKLFDTAGATPKTTAPQPQPVQKQPIATKGKGGGGGGSSGGGSGGGGSGGGGSGGGGSSGGGGGGGTPSSTGETPTTAEPTPTPSTGGGGSGSGEYWIGTDGTRHNPRCEFYRNVEGAPGTADEGVPCIRCGG